MESATYAALDKAWRSTCRVLFGEETCSLDEASEWLKEYQEKLRTEKSAASEKQVIFSTDYYSRSARFISYDEVDFGKKFDPITINEMKDIDSISEALRERAFYAGNVVLGNSSNIEQSSNVLESHYVLGSTRIRESKYVAYTAIVGGAQYCFGGFGQENVTHSVKCMGSELTRCFECNMVEVLSDCYYCAKSQNCRECMFCFGTENDSYKIGNTSLPKDKYLSLKKKLLSEMAEGLRKNKRLPSVLGILEAAGKYPHDPRLRFEKAPAPHYDAAPVEGAFAKTAALMFGRALSGIDAHSRLLGKNVPQDIKVKSALSGTDVYFCSYRTHLLDLYKLGPRMVSEDEVRKIGKLQLEPAAVERLGMDVDSLAEKLHPVAYTNFEKIVGNVRNYRDASIIISSQNVYHGTAFNWSKNCAHCFWMTKTEAMFGCNAMRDSSFCINCHYSMKMARCFEADNCSNCADAYFIHNCENVRDSMFCFNAKNLAHAIGNAALPLEQYKKIKGALVAQMADELEKKHDLRRDIFNICSAPAHK